MIYQEGGKDFRATAATDLGALNLGVQRSKFNDRCEIHLEVVVRKLTTGPIKGSIRIRTNITRDESLGYYLLPTGLKRQVDALKSTERA